MKKAYIFLAEGFEEIEALTPLDLLRRKGIDAKFVSISDKKEVLGSHNILFIADLLFSECDFNDGDAFILPGGMPGTKNLDNFSELCDLIVKMNEKGKIIAAICAAPMILGRLGLLKGKKATIYPNMESHLIGAILGDSNLYVDQNIITANALSAAIEFSLEIVEKLNNLEDKTDLRKEIVFNY